MSDAASLPTATEVPADVRELAEKFKILDPEALEDALLSAHDEAEAATLSDCPQASFPEYPPFGMEAFRGGLTTEKEIAQHVRLSKLVNELRREFEDVDRFSGLTSGNPGASMRHVLNAYADWLSKIEYTRPEPRRGAPPDTRSRAFVTSLARDWPALTGEPPTAWKDSYTREAGGRFYCFLQALWPANWPDSMLPWVGFPSVSTVARWLASLESDTHKSDAAPEL